MSEDERGKKDNASPNLKPEHARRHDMAPPGSVGTQAFSKPGFGSSDRSRAATQSSRFHQTAQKAQAVDRRPVFVETGDKEVDVEASKTNRMVSQEEFDRLKAKQSLDAYRRHGDAPEQQKSDRTIDQYRRGPTDDRSRGR